MKIDEIVVSMERKYNLGNYENVTFFQSVKIAIESHDDIDVAMNDVRMFLLDEVEKFKAAHDQQQNNKKKHFAVQAEQLLKETGADFMKEDDEL